MALSNASLDNEFPHSNYVTGTRGQPPVGKRRKRSSLPTPRPNISSIDEVSQFRQYMYSACTCINSLNVYSAHTFRHCSIQCSICRDILEINGFCLVQYYTYSITCTVSLCCIFKIDRCACTCIYTCICRCLFVTYTVEPLIKDPLRKGQPLYKGHFQYPRKCIIM